MVCNKLFSWNLDAPELIVRIQKFINTEDFGVKAIAGGLLVIAVQNAPKDFHRQHSILVIDRKKDSSMDWPKNS
jgi:hypothetical protein